MDSTRTFNREALPTDPAWSRNCPACGGNTFEDLTMYAPDEVAQQYRIADPKVLCQLAELNPVKAYSLIKCHTCGLEFATPLDAPSAAWYEVLYKNLALYPHARWEYEFVLQRTPKGASICDVGCGSGEFLRRATHLGFPAIGLDFSAAEVARGIAAGLHVHQAHLDNVSAANMGRHDAVVSFHTLEHLGPPNALFRVADALGTETAKLWISVPSDRRAARLYSEIDYLDLPPHHLTRWTKAALAAIGAKNGWWLTGFFYEPISFKQALWTRTIRSSLYRSLWKYFENETWLERLIRAAMYVPYTAVVATSRTRLSGFSMLALFERRSHE